MSKTPCRTSYVRSFTPSAPAWNGERSVTIWATAESREAKPPAEPSSPPAVDAASVRPAIWRRILPALRRRTVRLIKLTLGRQ